MVDWWKKKSSTTAKLTVAKEGHHLMYMEGEKYPLVGYPRGHINYHMGPLSKMKHEIKNQIFNESWAILEEGGSHSEMITHAKKATKNILKMTDDIKLDIVPHERMVPAVKEIYRAMEGMPLRDTICHFFQEDDAYRFRFQWLMRYLRKKPFGEAMDYLENAEIVDDMKGFVRLWKRVISVMLEDPEFNQMFTTFLKRVNYRKIKLTKADKYYFRGKWFKVDYPFHQY